MIIKVMIATMVSFGLTVPKVTTRLLYVEMSNAVKQVFDGAMLTCYCYVLFVKMGTIIPTALKMVTHCYAVKTMMN